MATRGIYSVSDKAMFDALNQHKVTNQDLKDIFFSRGILISKETPREELAKYFSGFTHGFDDYQKLSTILGGSVRRERSTTTKIITSVSEDDLEAAALKLCAQIAAEGEYADVTKHVNGDIEIHIKYTKMSLDKTEMRQSVQREAKITLEKSGNEFNIRSPMNIDVEDWKADLINHLEGEISAEVTTENISLEHISAPKVRTEFFTRLIDGITSLKRLDVSDVYVFHPKAAKESEDEENDNSDVDIGVHISKASLKGEGVLQSDELNSLYTKGFYIWKIVWTSKDEDYDSDIYEFEMLFSNPENFTGFSFICKGFYKYKGQGAYNASRTLLTSTQEKDFSQKIEKAARSLVKILSTAGGK